MRALVIFCHPLPGSFSAAVRDVVLDRLTKAGAETRLRDLYAEGFQPVLLPQELEIHYNSPANRALVDEYCKDVEWCDTLIFVYPTWWYGMPAMLKGWLDRVLLPDVAFMMPDAANANIRPGLTHIKRLGVFTTCGASWLLTTVIGAPGRRQLMQGVGWLGPRGLRKTFAAHYLMDSSTPESRARHLTLVGSRMDHLLRP